MAGPKDINNPPPIPEPEIPRNPADDRMREEVKDDKLYVDQPQTARIHNWVYTIIPLTLGQSESLGQRVVFTAYCKVCRSYFTEEIPFNPYSKATITSSSLPRYGCIPISDDVTLM